MTASRKAAVARDSSIARQSWKAQQSCSIRLLAVELSGAMLGDAELFQGAAKPCRLPLADAPAFNRPVIILGNENGVAVRVKAEENFVPLQQAAEQWDIASSFYVGEKPDDRDLASGVVGEAWQVEFKAKTFERAMEAGIEGQDFTFAGADQTTLTMIGMGAFAGLADAIEERQPTRTFAAERETFELMSFSQR